MDDHWGRFCSNLQQIGSELIAAAPDDATRAEGVAYLARLAAYGIERHLMGEERLTNGIGFSQPRIGGYNPDYRVGGANVDSALSYRIRGRMNQAYRVGLGLYSLQADGALALDDYRVLMAGSPDLDADGRFDIPIGAEADNGGLHLQPTTNLLLFREILLTPGGMRSDVALDTSGSAIRDRIFTPETAMRSLTAAGQFFAGSMKQFLGWTNHFASRPNTMEPLLPEFDNMIRGDPGTLYYTGYFDLRDDQALEIEIPKIACDYWGIMLANHWQEPLPASFLNHATARTDADGVAHIFIAPRDPGLANWLPTGGRSRGVIWHRTINADIARTPRCTLRG